MLFTFTLKAAEVENGNIAKKITALKKQNVFSKETNVFSLEKNSKAGRYVPQTSAVSKYDLLSLTNGLTEILNSKPEFLRISIPIENGTRSLKIFLYRADISPNGFTLLTSSGTDAEADLQTVNYRGSIENDDQSVAAFTFAANETMGLISTINGNYVLGKLESNAEGIHIIYNDRDLIQDLNFNCGTNTASAQGVHDKDNPNNNTTQAVKCTNWYWEVDYDVYTGKGSVANVTSYINGIFNQVAALYENDGMTITLKTLYVWNTSDPYTGPSTSNYLDQFGSYRTSFNGDLAHLIGYKGGGGIAWINGLCKSTTKYKMAYSAINSTYSNIPLYSWTINVVAHEQGHLFGSSHTHDCVWNGNNTAIDGCGPNAGYAGNGTCARGPIPAKGTIMSYCHLSPNNGIDLSLGFGTQPGTLMRSKISAATCLTDCCIPPAAPVATYGTSACPGVSSSTITPALTWNNTSGLYYTISLSKYPYGTGNIITLNNASCTGGSSYTVSPALQMGMLYRWNLSSNSTCGNAACESPSSSTLYFHLPPNIAAGGPVTFCQGGNVQLSLSPVPTPGSGTSMSFQWYNNGTAVAGATASAFTASQAGNYTVKITYSGSAFCTSAVTNPSNVISVSVTPDLTPSVSIAASPSSSVCTGTTVTFTATPVNGGASPSYQWKLNNVNVGSNTSSYSTSSLANSDVISCVMTSSASCLSANPVTSNSVTMTVITNSVPARPGLISGNAQGYCPNTSAVFSVLNANNIIYNWTAPLGASISSGQGTNSVQVAFSGSFTSGTLQVTASSGCASSTARTKSVNSVPVTPGLITGNGYNNCGTTGVYTIRKMAEVTGYVWSASNSGIQITPKPSPGDTMATVKFPQFTSAVLTVKATNACGAGTPRNMTVRGTVLPAPAIFGNATPTSCLNQTYNIDPIPGAASYNWSVPAGSTIVAGQGTSSIQINFGTTSGNITVKGVNACGNGSGKILAVTVSPCKMIQDQSPGSLITEIYPNPASTMITVVTPESGEKIYSVFNMLGEKVKDLKSDEKMIEISTADLPNGIYTLMVSGGHQNKKMVFAVQH